MTPFRWNVPDVELSDLQERIKRTRWPLHVGNSGWSYGTDLFYLQRLLEYWCNCYDWRKHERFLNTIPQFTTTIDEFNVHFVFQRGKGGRSIPLVLTHGWPSSFVELLSVLGPLTDPAAHGGDVDDAFDVVIPSLPGFGFSTWPSKAGWIRVDTLWRKLMTEVLGYRSFIAHGTDVGARVTSALGRYHSDVVRAIHIASVDLDWPSPLPDDLTSVERAYIHRVEHWERTQGAYAEIQATYPQTVAYGLTDSPVGLASWIVEKFRFWCDQRSDFEEKFTFDHLLTNIMIYWTTGCIQSSMRRYYEARHHPPDPLKPGEKILAPTGISMFPGETELTVPREFAERCYNLQYWSEPSRGGHFPAIEEPEVLVEEIRKFFRPFRG